MKDIYGKIDGRYMSEVRGNGRRKECINTKTFYRFRGTYVQIN